MTLRRRVIGERSTKTFPYPLSGKQQASGPGYVLMGYVDLPIGEFADYDVYFRASFQVTDPGLQGLIELVDVTGVETVIFSQTVTSGDIEKVDMALSLSQRSGTRTYELRCGLDPAGSYVSGDAFILWAARLDMKGM